MSQRRAITGSSAPALTVCMPVTVSTSSAWFSAPRANLSLSRARSTGTTARLKPTYKGSDTSTISVSGTLYSSITAMKITENITSSTSVSAFPVRKPRMCSSSRTRATESPTRRA